MIYLDAAATTLQKPPAVRKGMLWAMEHCSSVGRGGHAAAIAAMQTVFDCRCSAAELFDAKPEQVVFTMNATHGLNIAISSLVPEGGKVLISGFEHNAVTRPLHARTAQITVAGRKLFDAQDTLSSFAAALNKQRYDAVICTQVSNVFGYILPIEEIAELCKEKEVPLIIDASQGAGLLPLSLRKTGAAFIAMPGHKGLYGPQGTGLLLCGKDGIPLLYGGTGGNSRQQEMPDFLPDRLEAGTHNVCGIAGLREGLRFVRRQTPKKLLQREQRLLRKAVSGFRQLDVPCYAGPGQVGVLSLLPKTMDCEAAASAFAERAVALRAGLHCAPLAHESAGTLERGTLRLSFSAFTTEQDVTQLLKISKIILSEGGKTQFPPCY